MAESTNTSSVVPTLDLTKNERDNINYKYVIWKLIRNSDWKVDSKKYKLPIKHFPKKTEELLYKVLTVLDPTFLLNPDMVAEAAEFCEYWHSRPNAQ